MTNITFDVKPYRAFFKQERRELSGKTTKKQNNPLTVWVSLLECVKLFGVDVLGAINSRAGRWK